jgi:hypothetical protein
MKLPTRPAAKPVGLPQLLPSEPLRQPPAVGAGFLCGLAGGVDLDSAHFEIAVAGNRRDPAVALDLRIDRHAPARQEQAEPREYGKARRSAQVRQEGQLRQGRAQGGQGNSIWERRPCAASSLEWRAFAQRQVEIQAGKR